MVVGRKHRYVFIEVPHTGSTAVATELCIHYGGDPLYHKHSNYPEFYGLACDDEKRYFAFAGVRNPLDTVVTDYLRYRMNPNGQYTDPKMLAENGGWVRAEHLTRFDFVVQGGDFVSYFKRFYSNAKTYFNWYLVAHRPFDFVLRNEHLGEDFEQALRMLGVTPVRPLPFSNRTTDKRDFLSYYTPEIQGEARRIFGPFMKRWGYAFPSAWGDGEAPLSSELSFRAMEAASKSLSRVMRLGPHDPRIQDMRQIVASLRGRG